MTQRTCLQCQQAIPSERTAAAKYCSRKCGQTAVRDSSTASCSTTDCARPVRAKSLCATHYNRAHHPDRHAKTLTPCVSCGKKVLKGKGGGRIYGNVCSNECRSELRRQYQGQYSNLPKDHWALWFGKTSAWPRYPMIECAQCDTRFLPKSTNAKYCSRKCMYKAYDHKAGVRSQAETASVVRSCVRCAAGYQHIATNRKHCSDVCRDLDAQERGGQLYHGWIADSIRQAIYKRDDYTCWLCEERVDLAADLRYGNWAPSLDHVTPRSKGGTHEVSNLRTAHRWCNSVRSDSDPHELFAAA